MGMFWGLNMQPNHKYKQLVLKSFHMSGACINKGTSGRLYVKIDGVRHILAHLDSQIHKQIMFNLNFKACEELIFSFVGDASVTLYGFLLDEPDPEYETELEEDFKLLNEAFKKGVNNLASDVEMIQSGEQEDDKGVNSSEESESEASKDLVGSPPEAKKRKISNIEELKKLPPKKKPVKKTHIIHKPQPLYPQQLSAATVSAATVSARTVSAATMSVLSSADSAATKSADTKSVAEEKGQNAKEKDSNA